MTRDCRARFFIGLALVLIQGCGEPSAPDSPYASRIIFSTWYWESIQTVPAGEGFYISMNIENRGEDTLHFTHPIPEFTFRIMKGDSLLISSDEGHPVNPSIYSAELNPGGFHGGYWWAPGTPVRPSYYLPPGRYEVEGKWWATVPHSVPSIARTHLIITSSEKMGE